MGGGTGDRASLRNVRKNGDSCVRDRVWRQTAADHSQARSDRDAGHGDGTTLGRTARTITTRLPSGRSNTGTDTTIGAAPRGTGFGITPSSTTASRAVVMETAHALAPTGRRGSLRAAVWTRSQAPSPAPRCFRRRGNALGARPCVHQVIVLASRNKRVVPAYASEWGPASRDIPQHGTANSGLFGQLKPSEM
ncbi:hypothetical protein SAMN05216388_100918 [Halorientalis persicus]|uniref:Uncharacterized protein n=1 Tax=Halorientalis persicus TaxID=1367881 RepID=A0A1H8MJB8_9EURY|nr:hypothetical protein SAMN05216388_100918 [Halorientalis persicus]